MAFCLECSKHSVQLRKIHTFVYQLSPALGPFSQLLCICLFNTGSLVNTVHQVITQTIPIFHPLYSPFVITNLGRRGKDKSKCQQSNCKWTVQCAYECILPPKNCHWRHQSKSQCSQTWLPFLITWKRNNTLYFVCGYLHTQLRFWVSD